MQDYNDIVNTQIGFLFVRSRAPDRVEPSGRKKVQYWCDCSCGSKNLLRLRDTLKDNSKTHSCGCMTIEKIRKSNTRHGGSHKGSWQRLYRIWSLMKDRCNNSNSPAYKNYGGRGITVCDEWGLYESFREWALSNGYQDNLTLDRIDVSGNYTPNNCRWIPMCEQSKNRRLCNYITINNEKRCMSEWGRIFNISPSTISYRLKMGWSPEKAVMTPARKHKSKCS